MKGAARETAELFRRVAEAVAVLGENDIREILANGAEVLPSRVTKPRRERAPAARLSNDELSALRVELESLKTREAGVALLESRCANREQLEQLLRAWDLPHRKGETRSEVIDSLVEAAIGYRLRSEAIQRPLSEPVVRPDVERESDSAPGPSATGRKEP